MPQIESRIRAMNAPPRAALRHPRFSQEMASRSRLRHRLTRQPDDILVIYENTVRDGRVKTWLKENIVQCAFDAAEAGSLPSRSVQERLKERARHCRFAGRIVAGIAAAIATT